jgi:hypothetical protein
LSLIVDWAGSEESALKWYETEVIPALGTTAHQFVNQVSYNELLGYLKVIRKGVFA